MGVRIFTHPNVQSPLSHLPTPNSDIYIHRVHKKLGNVVVAAFDQGYLQQILVNFKNLGQFWNLYVLRIQKLSLYFEN